MPTVREVVEFLTNAGETEVMTPADAAVVESELVGISQDQSAGPGELAWLSPRQAQKHPGRVREFRGSLLLAPRTADVTAPVGGGAVVLCRNPKLAFSRAVFEYFFALTATRWPTPEEHGIAAGSRLGQRVTLGPGVVLGSDVTLGDDVVIGPNSCLANCTIGSNVIIGCNCTIGLPGFGYESDASGRYWRFPHIGRVVIEDDVEIGSNTCIDRGAIGDTVVGRGSKIDNLVHIAHNVTVGRNVLIIANSMVGGSTTVEDDVWLAPSTALMNQIRIGRGAVVGLGAVVLKDVLPSTMVVGNPAKPLERREPK